MGVLEKQSRPEWCVGEENPTTPLHALEFGCTSLGGGLHMVAALLV